MSVTKQTSSSDGGGASIGEAIQLVKQYAKQETIGPLKGAGRWIARGLAGAILLALGSFFAILGVLRLLQTETSAFDGRWMQLIPYLVALIVALIVIGLAVWRITKPTLQKESTR